MSGPGLNGILIDQLIESLKTSRYKLLVAIRPIQNARDSYGIIVQDMARMIETSFGETEANYFRENVKLPE